MTSLRLAAVLSLSLGLSLALASCTPPAPEPTPTVAETATPTPTPTPAPLPPVEPFAIACDTIVPAARFATLTSTSGTLTSAADFIAKVRSEVATSPYILMDDNGGVTCAWGGLEVVFVYGYAPLNPGQASEADALILAGDPYTTSAYAGGGTLYTSAMDGNPFTYFLVTDTDMYLATTTEVLDELVATVP